MTFGFTDRHFAHCMAVASLTGAGLAVSPLAGSLLTLMGVTWLVYGLVLSLRSRSAAKANAAPPSAAPTTLAPAPAPAPAPVATPVAADTDPAAPPTERPVAAA